MIKKSKKDHFNKSVKENKSPKYLWKSLNDVSNLNKSKNVSLPKVLVKNDTVIEGNANIINELNKHFVNISDIIKKTEFSKHNFNQLQKDLDSKLKYKELILVT